MKLGLAVLVAITCALTTGVGSAAKTRVAIFDLALAKARLVGPTLQGTAQGPAPTHPILLAIWYQGQLAALRAEDIERARLEQSTFEPIRAKARVVLAEVATKEGFDLVVDRSSAVVASDAVDITDDVVRAYDWSTR